MRRILLIFAAVAAAATGAHAGDAERLFTVKLDVQVSSHGVHDVDLSRRLTSYIGRSFALWETPR